MFSLSFSVCHDLIVLIVALPEHSDLKNYMNLAFIFVSNNSIKQAFVTSAFKYTNTT